MKSTKDIKIPEKLIDQVMGQEEAVKIIKKAALQRRHVLLIGNPGTGKSMLGLALAELLPNSSLKDIISLHNPNDENNPMIQEVPAGTGREEVRKGQFDSRQVLKNNNFILFIVAIITLIAPWWARHYYKSDIMFAAFFLGGMLFLAAFSIVLSMGQRMFKGNQQLYSPPKVIVDNFNKKQAPFFEATGAHAGALLGDVLHDPFQCFCPKQVVTVTGAEIRDTKIIEKIDYLISSNKARVYRKEKNGYEAVFLPQGELTVLGENNNSISPVDVLSCNRHSHNGGMIKLTTSENNELIVTPEHAIAIWKNGKISYIQAQDIEEGNEIVAKKEDIIIDEDDIINTYDERQQEQCRLYRRYFGLKKENPTWGYKRIAKVMNQPIGKTRWWHDQKHLPVPIQAAEWLKDKGLIPLKISHQKLPLIAKILGATFGDGGIFENLNGIFLSSSELEAVREFGTDLEELFSLNSTENSRIIEGGEYGHSWCWQNTNRNIIRFFMALGAAHGNKTKKDLKIPTWIKFKDELENEFYGSFLGGELGAPSLHIKKNRLTGLEVGITGYPKQRENRLNFLNEISGYFNKKGINTNSIYEGKTKSDNKIFRLQLSITFDNVLRFLINIKLNYCAYKTKKIYLSLGKLAAHKKEKYYKLTEIGYGAELIMKKLKLTPNSLYLLLNDFGPNKEETSL